MMKPIFSCIYSKIEIKNLSQAIYSYLMRENIKLVFLKGDVGSGKTTFVKNMIEHLSPDISVSSPTYTYVNEYNIGFHYIWHFDLYRIEQESSLYDLGIIDYLNREDGIALVEWPEKLHIENIKNKILILHFFHIEDADKRSCVVSIIE